MKSIFAVCLLVLLSACASLDSNSAQVVRLSTSGGSYGAYHDAKYYVILDAETRSLVDTDAVQKYVSYLLEYRGLHETAIQDSAEYFVVVSYSEELGEQSLQLTGVSRRVYEALGEVRPSWVAMSKHIGKPLIQGKMLPLHIMALRDFAGSNPQAYRSNPKYSLSDPYLLDLIAHIEQ